MAEPPPPPPLPTRQQEKGSSLPPTSRFPVLVSGQVNFTTADAIKDIEKVPKNVYRVQIDLQPRTNDSNFSDAPWTLVAKHLLSTIQLYDDTAIIIRKKENTIANKISSPEELPDNPDAFERDYAYDVKLKSPKLVSFKLIIGTRQPYWQTFREGPLFDKLVANDWYIKYVRLESQGTVAAIGHLLFAHNRYVNQEDVISEIRNLIYPTQCDQIDVRVTKSKEYYYEGNKKMRVFTRWVTIDCPVDIAKDLSNLLMKKWPLLKTEKKYENYNLRNTVYVPRHRGLVDFNARIENIGRQNEFLRTYKDVTVLRNVKNIDADFTYSKAMGDIFGDDTKVGHVLNLRGFLRSWNDNTTGKPAIMAIHRTNNEREYSLLSGHENMASIHEKIRYFITELQLQLGYSKLRVGGTKGTTNKQTHSDYVTEYAKTNFGTERKFQQKSSDHNDNRKNKDDESEGTREEDWKSPPLPNRRKKKVTKASLTVNYNDQRLIQQYSDVLVGKSYSTNNQGVYSGQTNTVPATGNNRGTAIAAIKNNTVTINEGQQTGIISRNNEGSIITQSALQQILESAQFQATLAKAVAPQVTKQVTSLVAPTIEKISHIESQVGKLHDYVSGNKKWQESQSERQSDLQSSMNQMHTTMNTLITMFKKDDEPEAGIKRPAPNIRHNPMNSPTRKQKMSNTQSTSSTESDSILPFHHLYDVEASNPQHSSQHTFSEESADAAMTPTDDFSEEGEEQ